MIQNRNQDHDNDHASDNDNEHGGKAITSAPTGGALTSLAALGAMLNGVDMTSVGGRSGRPMLSFKRDGSGTWVYGQKQIAVEDSSLWAINPLSYKRGYICFNDNNKVVGEHLVPVHLPMPLVTELPDKGFEWTEQWTADLKCLSGTDAGTEAVYKPTTNGGRSAVTGSIEAVRDRINGGQHDGRVVPIVRLEKDSYQHAQYGRIWTPVLTIVDWMSLDGPPAPEPVSPSPSPSPAPTSSAAEQPRRRRVA